MCSVLIKKYGVQHSAGRGRKVRGQPKGEEWYAGFKGSWTPSGSGACGSACGSAVMFVTPVTGSSGLARGVPTMPKWPARVLVVPRSTTLNYVRKKESSPHSSSLAFHPMAAAEDLMLHKNWTFTHHPSSSPITTTFSAAPVLECCGGGGKESR